MSSSNPNSNEQSSTHETPYERVRKCTERISYLTRELHLREEILQREEERRAKKRVELLSRITLLESRIKDIYRERNIGS
jgi:hypothetical protein